MKSRSLRKWAVHLTLIITLAVIYFWVAKLGLMLATLPGNVTAVWPPSGINLAALLLLGYKLWPGIALGSFVSVMQDVLTMQPPVSGVTSLAIAFSLALANSLETLSATFLIRKLCGTSIPLYRTENVLKFVAIHGMFSRPLCATISVTVLCLNGLAPWNAWGSIWWTWWTSGLVAALVFTPVILTWSRPLPHRKNRHLIEAILLLVLLFAVGYVSFGGGYPVVFMFLPILVWAAFRFGSRGATISIWIVSAIAILGTAQGHGSFVSKNPSESLVLLQSFVGVIALTTLVLSAVITERQEAQKALRKTLDELELRVADRTAALSEANLTLREQTLQLEFTLQELQKTQSQLIQNEKMSSLGELVAGLAHEINNPVNFIYGNLEHAKHYLQELLNLLQLYQQIYPEYQPEIQQKVESIELDYIIEDLPKLLFSMKMGADRIQKIIRSLRSFSRLDEAEMKLVDIHEGIDSTLLILQHRLGSKSKGFRINIIKEYGKLPIIECYAGELNQVFMNIIANAVDALEEGSKCKALGNHEESLNPPTIKIQTGVLVGCPDMGTERIFVKISNNGPTMTEDVKKRIFNPFFTTKPVGKGTGLGLAISYQIIVDKHRGELTFTSDRDRETEFFIAIPVKQRLSKKSTTICYTENTSN